MKKFNEVKVSEENLIGLNILCGGGQEEFNILANKIIWDYIILTKGHLNSVVGQIESSNQEEHEEALRVRNNLS